MLNEYNESLKIDAPSCVAGYLNARFGIFICDYLISHAECGKDFDGVWDCVKTISLPFYKGNRKKNLIDAFFLAQENRNLFTLRSIYGAIIDNKYDVLHRQCDLYSLSREILEFYSHLDDLIFKNLKKKIICEFKKTISIFDMIKYINFDINGPEGINEKYTESKDKGKNSNAGFIFNIVTVNKKLTEIGMDWVNKLYLKKNRIAARKDVNSGNWIVELSASKILFVLHDFINRNSIRAKDIEVRKKSHVGIDGNNGIFHYSAKIYDEDEGSRDLHSFVVNQLAHYIIMDNVHSRFDFFMPLEMEEKHE